MKRVGTVSRTAQGVAVVQLDEAAAESPAIGTVVVDESLSRVGLIVDIFGPVERPYAAISPDSSVSLASLVGSKLYAR